MPNRRPRENDSRIRCLARLGVRLESMHVGRAAIDRRTVPLHRPGTESKIPRAENHYRGSILVFRRPGGCLCFFSLFLEGGGGPLSPPQAKPLPTREQFAEPRPGVASIRGRQRSIWPTGLASVQLPAA